ncbi:MAG: NACHT domain-containing protein [Opitutales bacterium]|nr:NACHT domain-containing protein [Opitutales bacterium]
MRAPNRLQTIEEMRDELKIQGVELEVWDSEELNTKLKEHPFLVADFFHEAWSRSFCSFVPENLAQRLSAKDVGHFRQACHEFYEQCFAQADAGWITSGSSSRPMPPLAQRFIDRNIIEKREDGLAQIGVNSDLEQPSAIQDETRTNSRDRTHPTRRRPFPRIREVRTPLSEWLAQGGQVVLAGEPGAGKSTALRFLALDLLSASPTLRSVAAVWGDHLPVWVPFPLWTRRIAERGTTAVSLIELLQEWFTSYSNNHLWPLVERALADDRLLLLVDGLDEWRDEPAARVALQLLQVFIGQRKTPAILVGRPQGLSALGPFPSAYREATLAPLDRSQQREFVQRLLGTDEVSATQIDAFFRDLDQLPALRATAGTPLLLGLLFRQHLEHARLPLSRFRAGERMVETLLRDHPIRRQQAALLCTNPLLVERELRETLAYVAWRAHTERAEGVIDRETVREWLQTFLSGEETGLGYTRLEARKIADELLRHGEREFGILVERAPGWFGFFHRTIQELLAAEHLGTMERAAQLAVLRERADQPHWREVLLAWCHRRTLPDFAEIVTTLEQCAESPNVTTRHRLAEILAELGTGDFSLPTNLARRLVGQTVEKVWTSEWPRHRRHLLDLVLDGLHGSHAVRSIVQAAVRAWFPARMNACYGLAAKTANWASSPELNEALLHTLHHEEESAQRSAAEALGVFASHNSTLADKLANIAETSIRATTRACALEAFARSRPDETRLQDFAERERLSGSGEVAITAINIRIRKNLQTDNDLKILLRRAERRAFDVGYNWRDDLIEALLSGWPGSAIVKGAIIKSLAREHPRNEDAMDHEIAFPVLIRGFAGHEDAAIALALFFQRKNVFIHSLYHFREWLPGNSRWFAEHPNVAKAMESYLFTNATRDAYKFAQLALLARTDRVKTHLLEEVNKAKAFCYWPAWALIQGWGPNDPAVTSALKTKLETQPDSAGSLAKLIPQIFEDHGEARARLLHCLTADKVSWPWLCLSGLVAVDGHLRSPDVLEVCLRLEDRAPEWERESIRNYLIEHAAPDARVRAMALAELDEHDGSLTSVAQGFGHDAEIRDRIIGVIAPLPAELRAVIVDRLDALPTGDPFAAEMLSQFDTEGDGEVKARAAVAYARREQASGSLTQSLVARLRSLLHAVGPDNEERRQAALAALLELGEFDAISSEFSGRFGDGSWLFSESYRNNKETLLRQLAKHWTDLKGCGTDFFHIVLCGVFLIPVGVESVAMQCCSHDEHVFRARS